MLLQELGVSVNHRVVHGVSLLAQSLHDRHGVSAVHIARSCAASYWPVGRHAIQGNLFHTVSERQRAIVLEQHCAFRCRVARHDGVSLEVRVVLVLIALEVWGLHYVAEDAAHAVVQVFLAQSPALHGFLNVLYVVFSTWLQQVVAGVYVGSPVGKSVKG